MEKALKWENLYYYKINDTHGTLMNEEFTIRAKVINGWLVKHTFVSSTASSNQRTETMTFVPDKGHKWIQTPN